MKIIDIGMNHKTAPVELRERLAYGPGNPDEILNYLMDLEPVKEALYLSTCNRVEAIVVTDDEDAARRAVVSHVCNMGNISQDNIFNFIYMHKDLDAVRHIFRVAASLDSMVVGEPQILGQIKEAYARAVRLRSTGVILNGLMHRAFHVAKKVRSETGICESAVSVSYAAVELAKKIFDTLFEKKVLLIGAGEMSELTARYLMRQGVKEVVVANRTFKRAMELASKFGSHPISFEEIDSYLVEADIVITSTASPGFVITRDRVRGIMRKRRNRPLFFIDIAVPRDVEPEVNEQNNIYLYDIDDLKGIAQMNMEQRRQEAIKAERIIEEEVIMFDKWLKTLDIVPTIISLKNKADAILKKELRRSEPKLKGLNQAEREAVLMLCRSITEKLINDPILFLKSKVGRPALNNYLDFARKFFNLEPYERDIYKDGEGEDTKHKFHN